MKNNYLEINEICNLKEIYGVPALIAHFSLDSCDLWGEKREILQHSYSEILNIAALYMDKSPVLGASLQCLSKATL